MSFLFHSPLVNEEALRLEAIELLTHKRMDQMDFQWLTRINNEKSTDLASMIFYEWSKHQYTEFINKQTTSQTNNKTKSKILISPTLCYKEHPELGGEASLINDISESLRLDVDTVPLISLGSVQSNAEIIIDHFKNEVSDQIWLVSISKGALDLKRAIQLAPEIILPKVRGWINLVGMIGGTLLTENKKGTPLSFRLLKYWLRIRGGRPNISKEMGKNHPFSKSSLSLPENITTISVVAIPLISHLRKPVLKSYLYLSQFGPNDGYVLLEDSILPNSIILSFWGADHYLRTPELSKFANQMLSYISRNKS